MESSSGSELSDKDLLNRLTSLCAEDARLKAEIVAYLIEIEERRLHLRMACSSMFDFCTRLMKMSENVAVQRIAAARLARRHPCLLPAIASGELHLSTVILLKDHVTAANAEELLAEVRGKSYRDVQRLLAARAPKPDLPERVAPLAEQAVLPTSSGVTAPTHAGAAPRVTPLSPRRYGVQLTVSQETHDKLERAKALMRHRNASGDLEVILDRALDALLAKLEKELHGKTERARRSPGARRGDVTRAARREVFARDGEQCVYEDASGNRCPARGFLEIDHIAARALGGDGDASNLRVLCKPHNRLHAEQVFGREHVERAIDLRRSTSARAPSGEPALACASRTAPSVEILDAATGRKVDEPPAEAAGLGDAAPAGHPERPRRIDESASDDARGRALRGLTNLGFQRGEAARALDAVLERHGPVLARHALPEVLRETIARLT